MRRLIHRNPCLFAAAWLLLAGCSGEPASGPGEVVWDRDICERCSMAIGDRRFATQVRDVRDQRLRRFDDLGCALLWLAEREHAAGDAQDASRPEVWVRDPAGERWIDGHATRFSGEFETPMGYGFGAAPGDASGTLDLPQVRSRLLAREDERRSVER